jgi:hypothetical protein
MCIIIGMDKIEAFMKEHIGKAMASGNEVLTTVKASANQFNKML